MPLFGKKSNAPAPSIVTKTDEKEVERQQNALQQLNKATIQTQTKMLATEIKVLESLYESQVIMSNEPLRSVVTRWLRDMRHIEGFVQMVNYHQKTAIVDQLKRLGTLFPHVLNTLKDREQLLQECNALKEKVEKYERKNFINKYKRKKKESKNDLQERTGQNLTNLAKYKEDFTRVKQQFDEVNEPLRADLPKLLDSRVGYFQPSFSVLLACHASLASEIYQTFAKLREYLAQNQEDSQTTAGQLLDQIRQLSIAGN